MRRGLICVMISVFIAVSLITTVQAAWWDDIGTPKYGGTITIRGRIMDVQFDPHWFSCGSQFCFETMFQPDWTLSPDIHPFLGEFIEAEYFTGILAESWEQSGPLTFSVHLRQGIHWHDKAPVNGRELVADDVVYTYHRVMGSGSGFTQPNPFMVMAVAEIDSVKATDRYTVEFTLKAYSYSAIIQIMYGGDTKGMLSNSIGQ